MTRSVGRGSRRPPVDDLRAINAAITTISRVSNSRRARNRIEARAGVGLGPAAIATLAAIRSLAPATNRAVAARAGLEPSRISKEVRALLADGLVEEHGDPADRRVTLLATTPAGERAYAAYHEAANAALAEVLSGWDRADVASLRSLLDRLAEGFAHPPGTAPREWR